MDSLPLQTLGANRRTPACVVDVRLSLGADGLFWVMGLARAMPVWSCGPTGRSSRTRSTSARSPWSVGWPGEPTAPLDACRTAVMDGCASSAGRAPRPDPGDPAARLLAGRAAARPAYPARLAGHDRLVQRTRRRDRPPPPAFDQDGRRPRRLCPRRHGARRSTGRPRRAGAVPADPARRGGSQADIARCLDEAGDRLPPPRRGAVDAPPAAARRACWTPASPRRCSRDPCALPASGWWRRAPCSPPSPPTMNATASPRLGRRARGDEARRWDGATRPAGRCHANVGEDWPEIQPHGHGRVVPVPRLLGRAAPSATSTGSPASR